ncbi:MAG: hypothetical protein EZS28_019965 [Streblomastix strix]|uniref:Uncharacterized protein n=1 Tax=Streblomastix strix TaxID=222440 RepID=A0A5J4VPD8_9EUKA|nr:MAG: hypothetical protein EZS28_019965 [Streblomastix strix]
MQSNQKNFITAKTIIRFIESDTKNQERKRNEQSDSEQATSVTDIVSTLKSLYDQIRDNNTCKQMIQIPKLLQSLIALACYKIRIHFNKDIDRQSLEVRSRSRHCLWYIQFYGDEQVQSELVNIGFGRVMFITFCTAGGVGEEQDVEISNGLIHISEFLAQLHKGRNNFWQSSFQPLPSLARSTEEQVEEEGTSEELEAQMNNNVNSWNIKYQANDVKAATLNRFINWRQI